MYSPSNTKDIHGYFSDEHSNSTNDDDYSAYFDGYEFGKSYEGFFTNSSIADDRFRDCQMHVSCLHVLLWRFKVSHLQSLAQLNLGSRKNCTVIRFHGTRRHFQPAYSGFNHINIQVSDTSFSLLCMYIFSFSIKNFLANRARYQSSTLLFYHIFMGSIALGDIIFASNLWLRIKHVKTESFDFMGDGFVGKSLFCVIFTMLIRSHYV